MINGAAFRLVNAFGVNSNKIMEEHLYWDDKGLLKECVKLHSFTTSNSMKNT